MTPHRKRRQRKSDGKVVPVGTFAFDRVFRGIRRERDDLADACGNWKRKARKAEHRAERAERTIAALEALALRTPEQAQLANCAGAGVGVSQKEAET